MQMKKFNKIFIIMCAIFLAIAIFVAVLAPIKTPEDAVSRYMCDVNPFALKTCVNIKNSDGTELYNVNGEYFSAFEDNLVMQDTCGNIVREMNDNYNFITQNDHTILDGNGFLYICEGNVNFMGNSYQVFDNKKEQVGNVWFDAFNTRGTISNMDGEIVAQYNSKLFCSDYVVSIFENCAIDEASVLMMFASYVSDIRADE
jgi:uncharacterized protein YxjI